MEIMFNGGVWDTPAHTLAELAREWESETGRIVFEHNGVAIPPSRWGEVRLCEGDCIEALKISAGG